jgi:hypothetical protein
MPEMIQTVTGNQERSASSHFRHGPKLTPLHPNVVRSSSYSKLIQISRQKREQVSILFIPLYYCFIFNVYFY